MVNAESEDAKHPDHNVINTVVNDDVVSEHSKPIPSETMKERSRCYGVAQDFLIERNRADPVHRHD
jgi:hypothetical protein